ncbi:uncharacterized protein F4812DRAFT_447915 [Daldinia caldariorum]|uniref:uncharacterized protein n=1 Tax=Daldinia caldariorum TaxID=326644 RepID=UPI002007E6E6|nr:uncharacterized protein F4812DRAFT_447915 [Daldinia caldariorum]KAI1463190.1 hypothetical protein F4812DRAFT_447915 [Daldinia caldariorum]
MSHQLTTNPSPTSIRTLQALAILLLTTTAGASSSLSLFLVPRLMESPTRLMVEQFRRALASSQRILSAPIAILLPGLLHAYLACAVPGEKRKARVLYAVAAALTLSAWPWTRLAMEPLQSRLEERAVMATTLDEEEPRTAHQLVDSWAMRNLYRPVVNLAAGVIGLYAALW